MNALLNSHIADFFAKQSAKFYFHDYPALNRALGFNPAAALFLSSTALRPRS